jgi:hypothetical protein
MKAKVITPGKKSFVKPSGNKGKDIPEEYKEYPANEDIYNKFREETAIDPEDISRTKEPVKRSKSKTRNENEFFDDESGDDLDIPGSELDDDQEFTGNEDEENNYYSLGGDNHNNLEEDKDDM